MVLPLDLVERLAVFLVPELLHFAIDETTGRGYFPIHAL